MAQVLLVEDEALVLMFAEIVLQGLGYSTLSAGSQAAALALFNDPGGVDLLFTDIRLPDSDLGGVRARPGGARPESVAKGALHDGRDCQ
jgi:CheY-like chemotaxis protein